MKLWFGTTTLKFKEYEKYHLGIRQHLLDKGHVLTDDWIGKWWKWLEKNPNAKRNIKKIYELVTKSIDEAEAIIIEFTVPNFSTSHQITYALQQKKPVLVMRLSHDNTFPDSYIEAIDSPFLTLKQYNEENYKDIIDEFLGYAEIEPGQGRYNIVLNKKQKFYLDWASANHEKSRSKIIRDLIDDMMAEDSEFKLYLKE